MVCLQIPRLDESLKKFVPLTEEEMARYTRRDLGCIVITPTDLRFDMSRKAAHPFNVEALEVLAADFICKVKNEGWYSDPEIPAEFLLAKNVKDALQMHIKYVFGIWRDVTAPDTPEKREKKLGDLERASRSVRKTQVDLILHQVIIIISPALALSFPPVCCPGR